MNENKGPRRPMIAAGVSLLVLCLFEIGSVMGWWLPPPLDAKNVVGSSLDEKDGIALNAAADCRQCGVIESIRVETELGKSSAIGAVAGTTGEGADSHREMGKRIRRHTNFRIVIRMADGTHRKIYSRTRDYTVGQKVMVLKGHIMPYSNS